MIESTILRTGVGGQTFGIVQIFRVGLLGCVPLNLFHASYTILQRLLLVSWRQSSDPRWNLFHLSLASGASLL
jgi:hypothetical protein